MDKYEKAIEFLQSVEPGSYFDECAALMEELLFLAQPKPKRQKQSEKQRELLRQAHLGALFYARSRNLL